MCQVQLTGLEMEGTNRGQVSVSNGGYSVQSVKKSKDNIKKSEIHWERCSESSLE